MPKETIAVDNRITIQYYTDDLNYLDKKNWNNKKHFLNDQRKSCSSVFFRKI